jgi:RNA polymerase I-specific transcription initiation factor RRN3
MHGSALQKLLNKQKLTKFGALVCSESWPELHESVISGSTKLDDLLTAVVEHQKQLSFTQFMLSLAPISGNLRILNQLLTHLTESDLGSLIPFFRDFILSAAQSQSAAIDLVIRSFTSSDSPAFSESIVAVLQASPLLHSIVSLSLTKFFPQTSFPVEQQLRYLRGALSLCSQFPVLTPTVFPRVFQHLVALDCEMTLDPAPDGSFVVDDDVAVCLSPQFDVIMNFLNGMANFAILLPLFDTYLIELPRTSASQFLFFYLGAMSEECTANFIGFLLGKIIDSQGSHRARANAALYLASFVVRAKFIGDELGQTILDYVADFARKYIVYFEREAPGDLKLDLDTNFEFYYAVQCVVYVL